MNRPTDRRSTDPRSIRRVVLPDGRSVEVLFAEGTAEQHAAALERQRVRGLHVCPDCSSKLVMPLAWGEAGRARWDVTLHCPNCDWIGSGVFGEELVERFDEELDRGTEALVRDLQRLMRANMEDEIERFVAALAADAILPEDF
jgi:hypothetical protein